jgi:MFS family permease
MATRLTTDPMPTASTSIVTAASPKTLAQGTLSNSMTNSSITSSSVHAALSLSKEATRDAKNDKEKKEMKQRGEMTDTSENLAPQQIPLLERKHVLYLMCALKIITSYDSGAYGAVLGIDDGIAQALQLSVVDEGALGSAPFVGNTLGCAAAGILFSRYEAKPLLMFGMGMHFVCTILFAMSPTFIIAVCARTLIGFTLSFVVVYSVVWTDVFSPRASATTWLAAMNAGVPLGMLLGFVMGGAVTPELELSWRLTFLFKAMILLPVLLALHRAPARSVNDPGATDLTRKRRHEAQLTAAGVAEPNVCESVIRNASTLLRNELFVCAVLGLVVLYFVVTAMQVFVTSYLRGAPFYASMSTIVFGFGAASVTAPVFGVVAGGMIVDRLGGYSNLKRAALFGAACGTGAAWFGLLACYMTTVPTFIAALWFMLFVGAANVPVGTGILMAAVPPAMRPTASAYAAVAFNTFGYFLGPIVCGAIADRTGLQQAFHIVLMMSSLGCIPLGLTVVFASNFKAAEAPGPESVCTPNVVDNHSMNIVMEGDYIVSVPTTPQQPQKEPGSVSPFDERASPISILPPVRK